MCLALWHVVKNLATTISNVGKCCRNAVGGAVRWASKGRSLSELGITRTASQVENGKTLIKGLLPGTVRIEGVLHEFQL